jgi:hypothetical protein
MNFVGDIVGSAQQNAIPGVTPIAQVISPTIRAYDGTVYGATWGYQTTGDTGNGSLDSATPYATAFIHGLYNNVNSTTTWATGLSHTLPPSFYLSSKPSWFGTGSWPAIGPDVTGSGATPYVTNIPAQNCYASIGGTDGGAGSPFTFSATNCYYSVGSLAPPTNITLSVH